MKNLLLIVSLIALIAGCGLLDSDEDEIVREEFIPFVEINKVEFSEDEAIITATIAKPNPCWSYVATNILLRDGEYYFAARGYDRGVGCTDNIDFDAVKFNVKLKPYGTVSLNFLSYNNTYIDTVVVPGN